jgi:hypothetical protein
MPTVHRKKRAVEGGVAVFEKENDMNGDGGGKRGRNESHDEDDVNVVPIVQVRSYVSHYSIVVPMVTCRMYMGITSPLNV